MTREEAKKAAEVMMAYANGEEIETLFLDKYVPCKYPFFNWADYRSPKAYRIKQKATYRPFKDKEECWNEMQKHQPFGWVQDKGKTYINVNKIGGNPDGIDGFEYSKMFRYVTFADGTPFGIKEE